MKYESELIKEIVDARGHEKSPLHYQSECVENWINEAKGAYPKLCDYESEWLNYINENPIGEFPYESFTGTEGTIENVVPYAYKSAILKGNTLVNINRPVTRNDNMRVENGLQILTTWSTSYNIWMVNDITLFKPNTKYYIIVEVVNNTLSSEWRAMVGSNDCVLSGSIPSLNFASKETGIKCATFTTKSDFTNVNCGLRSATGVDETVGSILEFKIAIIEYQDGMENWDIPYFEGMQSVKMPVLTTIGKNLMSSSLRYDVFLDNDGLESTTYQDIVSKEFIQVESSTSYGIETFYQGEILVPQNIFICEYDNGKNFIKRFNAALYGVFATDINTKYIKFSIGGFGIPGDIEERKKVFIELEKTKIKPTAYEPYKTNILTVNEEVELRGIGDVQDELDLLTGEKVERIGEIVLNGSENWKTLKQGRYYIKNILNNVNRPNKPNINLKCDKLNPISYSEEYSGTLGIVLYEKTDYDFIVRTDIQTIEEFKQWLSNNPTTVHYQLATESVKTVDLTVIDQDGNTESIIRPIEGTMHIATDGTPIKPTFECEVPVEAITQNLAAFIEE